MSFSHRTWDTFNYQREQCGHYVISITQCHPRRVLSEMLSYVKLTDIHSKKRTLDLGDILRYIKVKINYLLLSKWKLHFNVMFHIPANSCQLFVKLDIDISTVCVGIWVKVLHIQEFFGLGHLSVMVTNKAVLSFNVNYDSRFLHDGGLYPEAYCKIARIDLYSILNTNCIRFKVSFYSVSMLLRWSALLQPLISALWANEGFLTQNLTHWYPWANQ